MLVSNVFVKMSIASPWKHYDILDTVTLLASSEEYGEGTQAIVGDAYDVRFEPDECMFPLRCGVYNECETIDEYVKSYT